MMSKIDENLSQMFNMEQTKQELTVRKPDQPIAVKVDMDDADKDFQKARENLKELISLGFNAIDGVLKVASEGDSPRAYEVVAQMLKTVAETNKDLVELHQRMKTIKEDKYESNTTNNTTNAIFLGSTKDLQELLNPKRSFSKALKDSTEILDGTKKMIQNGG